MYAVIQHGSHQYRVSVGDKLLVDRVKADVGSSVKLENILLLGDAGDGLKTEAELAKAIVTATVVAHRRGRKLRVMTYKPKKRHRRTMGYRSQLTELLIEDIQGDGSKPVAAKRSAPVKAEAKPEPKAKSEPKSEAAAAAAASAPKTEPESAAEQPEVVTDKPAPRARRTSTKKTAGEKTPDGA
jgi:large subunit ribosomal protein L21